MALNRIIHIQNLLVKYIVELKLFYHIVVPHIIFGPPRFLLSLWYSLGGHQLKPIKLNMLTMILSIVLHVNEMLSNLAVVNSLLLIVLLLRFNQKSLRNQTTGFIHI